ncbi:MAG: Sapep family Mn(2+)-dependent dipeptidase [Clostridia bacterium]|nr:Sapep family Mn(2+)-dependent dipeptidase [Clostridia bacterium]
MKNYEDYLKTLGELIAIDSVQGKAEKGAPFGKGVKTALRKFLSVAENFGFQTINYDDYAGEVVYGSGQEIGIIGHLDVVPVGDGWNYPPFALTKSGGYLIGRGVGDDKGALLLCLYALKELKDGGGKCRKKFRLIVGCNEESGWQDVKYLKTKTTIPEYGFSPDGNFPVGYAEKGSYYVKVKIPPFKKFGAITGGTVVNAVCAFAKVKINGEIDESLIKKHGLNVNCGYVESVGVAAHGSQPQLGKNAILPLLEFLKDSGEDVEDYINYLFRDGLKLSEMKNEQGVVTFSPDVAKDGGDGTVITCDCRIPAPFTAKDVEKRFAAAPFALELLDHHLPPVMVEKNGKFVETLLSAYNAFAKTAGEPVSMGGSTFARVFKKGCAFGPEFPDENYHLHEADERVNEKLILKAYDVYKKAIFDLAALKEDL